MSAKSILKALLIVVAICIAFYVYGRVEASNTEIRVEHVRVVPRLVESGSFTVAAYNIAHARGAIKGTSNWGGSHTEKVERSRAIGEFLATSDADVVILNEVDFDASWSGRQDQAMLIAKAGGFQYVARQVNFNLALPGFSLEFGNAILSHYPIIVADRVALPTHSWLESLLFGNHDAIRAVVEVGESQEVEIWGLHLEVRDRVTRISAVEHIASQMDTARPVVLAGDLNSQLSEGSSDPTALSTLLHLTDFESFPSTNDSSMTFPTMAPKRTLDWIAHSPLLDASGGEVADVQLSDHLPVLIRLRVL